MRCIRKKPDILKTHLSRNTSKKKFHLHMATKEKFVPVLIESPKVENFPFFRKKFMVPFHMPASQFSNLVRSQMQLPSHQSFTLLLHGTRLQSTMPIGRAYNKYKYGDGPLRITVATESTFGCRAHPIRPVSPQFVEAAEDIIFAEESTYPPESIPPDVDVIHLTVVVSNPITNVEQPVSTALSLNVSNQEHMTGILDAITEVILTAVSSVPMQNLILQSAPNSEITINPQLVKDALLNYIEEHSLTFTPPFDADNFCAVIKVTPPTSED